VKECWVLVSEEINRGNVQLEGSIDGEKPPTIDELAGLGPRRIIDIRKVRALDPREFFVGVQCQLDAVSDDSNRVLGNLHRR
jgi:hypothetical protein